MNIPESFHLSAQGDCEILIMRVFNAPRHLVFDAYTKPELVKRWLGVRVGWTLAVCEIDLKVGGSYRYVWRKAAKGIEMGVGGIYKEIIPQERIVCTERFDDLWYDGEALITTIFLQQGERTTLSINIRYESQETRDAVLKTPMESGVAESYNNLAELLATLQ